MVGVSSTQPRKLSWHALAVGPLSPPACLSLKSWPERSDPAHLIASGRVFARLARSPGSRESKTLHVDASLSYKVSRGGAFFAVHLRMYVLQCSSLGLPRTAPPIRDSTHFTHGRVWQGFAVDDRRCCIVSRSRPLTACQGTQQLLLHLHGYSIQVHDVPSTCLPLALSGPPSTLSGAFRHLSDQCPGHNALRSWDYFELWDTICFAHAAARRAVPCTDRSASCLPRLPAHPGVTGRSCRTAANWHRHTHTHTYTHTHTQGTHAYTHTHTGCDPPLLAWLAISHTRVAQELEGTEVTQTVRPIHPVADL